MSLKKKIAPRLESGFARCNNFSFRIPIRLISHRTSLSTELLCYALHTHIILL